MLIGEIALVLPLKPANNELELFLKKQDFFIKELSLLFHKTILPLFVSCWLLLSTSNNLSILCIIKKEWLLNIIRKYFNDF